jgi:hypothetical protein
VSFASGVAAALAGRVELRISPRPALLTRVFGAYLLFAGLLLIPVSVYFYVFHGDWFLLYLVDVRKIPSAVALLGFLIEMALGASGFLAGAGLVRSQRDTAAGVLLGLAVVAAGAVVPAAVDRLALVGSFAQYQGGFGLEPYGSGPLLQGTLVMGLILLVGLGFLLLRIHMGGRKM